MRYLICLTLLMTLFARCSSPEQHTATATDAPADTLVLALDWSPNVLHAGILYADTKGWFDSAGVHLKWYSTEIDNYTKKPILRVMDGEADLAIGPTEHILHYATDSTSQVSVQAIGTLLQRDQSVFAVKESTGISRPADLSGQTYVGYHTPMEEAILSTMIKTDGGAPSFDMIHPPRLDVWDAFLADSGDIVWIFTHWEGQLAKADGVALNWFYPSEYGVPYGYSSVVFAPSEPTAQQAAMYPTFWKVAAKGYRAVQADLPGAATWLCEHIDHPNFEDPTFIEQALADIAPAYFPEQGTFGYMQEENFSRYLDWMIDVELLDQAPIPESLYTNTYLNRGE